MPFAVACAEGERIVGFFDRIGEMFEEREERRERQEYLEEREEFLEEMEWEMEGSYYDRYAHGDLFFDPALGHHGVFYNGVWHPLDYRDGSWVFVHPRLYNVPRGYQPTGVMPPQQPGYGGFRPTAPPQPAQLMCPRCRAPQPVGAHFCASCGNDLQAAAQPGTASHCSACGAALTAGARFCGSCGRSQL